MTLDERYSLFCATPTDIYQHLPTLATIAGQCTHITEFGTRGGISTTALFYGRPRRVVCYDIERLPAVYGELARLAQMYSIEFDFHEASSLAVEIERTDFLFIDSLHTEAQLAGELARHAGQVRRWIALHDTAPETYGERGEVPGTRGLLYALRPFLAAHPEWTEKAYYPYCSGLTVLERSG